MLQGKEDKEFTEGSSSTLNLHDHVFAGVFNPEDFHVITDPKLRLDIFLDAEVDLSSGSSSLERDLEAIATQATFDFGNTHEAKDRDLNAEIYSKGRITGRIY